MENTKICSWQDCTLCMACANICPKKAINVSANENGYEKLIIDPECCVDCGLCAKVCTRRDAVPRYTPKASFAAQSYDKQKLKNSASGGAFQMLALSVLALGGVCYGAEIIHEEEFRAKHIRIADADELKRILNSKYIPSLIGDTFQQAKIDLDNGITVLFSGLPCQIQGLKAFLNKQYENLITVDLICHGITSAKLFNDYIRETERKKNITIVDYQFRDKSVSWGTNFCYSYYSNNDPHQRIHTKHCPREVSSYMIHYLRGNIFRENCYHCALANTQRVSDFTLGDYWEIETEHPEFVTKEKPGIILRQGVSCIMVNTERAEQFITELNCRMFMREVTLESISKHNGNLQAPSKRGSDRDKLLQIYREQGYCEIEQQYQNFVGKKALIYNIKNSLKAHLPDRIRILIYNTPFLRRLIFR